MASRERKIKSKTEPNKLNPVLPNAGVEGSYRASLWGAVTSMHNSLTYHLARVYLIGGVIDDLEVVEKIKNALENVRLRWFTKFDEIAPRVAANFVAKNARNIEKNFEIQMSKRKFGIKFELTPEMQAVAHAEIVQNVTLIQSIPSQYFTEIEGLVMRSVAAGGDLKSLSQELRVRFGLTRDRAAKIALDQNKKVNAVLTRLRQKELGITKAIWLHQTCLHPRQSHIDYSGKEYDVEKGALIDGELIFPGQKIGCHCVSRGILPSYLRDEDEL